MELTVEDQKYLQKKKVEIVDNCPKCAIMRSPGCDCAERLRWEVDKVCAGIPLLLRGLTIDNFTHPELIQQKNVLNQIITAIANSTEPTTCLYSWIFSGAPGTGKTMGACLILQELIKKRVKVKYISSPRELADIIANSWRNDGAGLEGLKQAQVIVLDGVGGDMTSIASNVFSALVSFLNDKVLGGTKLIVVSSLARKDMVSPQDMQLANLTSFHELSFAGFSYSMILEMADKRRNGYGN